MTSTSASVYAHLYLGNPETDPAPVFRDLSPEGVRLPDGTLVAWPEGARFGVYFDGVNYETSRVWRPESVDRWHFFGDDGYPTAFPLDCRVPVVPFKREFQVHPYDWPMWQPYGDLLHAATRELTRPGFLARMRAQANIGRRMLASTEQPAPHL